MEERIVFVLQEDSIWDYETDYTCKKCEVFDSFEKANELYQRRVEMAKEDILNFVSEEDVEIDEEFKENEVANFSIYENGDYTRTHCDISIFKTKIQ